jgi:hypothetical protein
MSQSGLKTKCRNVPMGGRTNETAIDLLIFGNLNC